MDTIHIRDLEVFANHGVYPEENRLGQKFVVSADLSVDTREAGRTDDLEKSVNYGEVSLTVQKFLKEHTFKLIEAVAEGLAEKLFSDYPLVHGVRLEIQKPWAPVGLPLRTVSVEIRRSRHRVYIALGSNMGEKKAYLDEAVSKLSALAGCSVKKVSDWIATAPYGVTDQAEFLNGVLELETLLTPQELLDELHAIEAEAHRERILRWGPRTLDLDILLYDNEVIDTENLHIPHIDMQNRYFVLEPLSQIAPWVRHPVLNKTIEQLRRELDGGLTGTEK